MHVFICSHAHGTPSMQLTSQTTTSPLKQPPPRTPTQQPVWPVPHGPYSAIDLVAKRPCHQPFTLPSPQIPKREQFRAAIPRIKKGSQVHATHASVRAKNLVEICMCRLLPLLHICPAYFATPGSDTSGFLVGFSDVKILDRETERDVILTIVGV